MGATSPRELHCYAPRPVTATLRAFDAAVHRRLSEVKGFLRTSGATPKTIAILMAKVEGWSTSPESVVDALTRLEKLALVRQVTPGNYVVVKVKHVE